MVPSEVSAPGSGPRMKKANAFFKASVTTDQGCRGRSCPAHSLRANAQLLEILSRALS